MKKSVKKNRPMIKACGGKKGKGCSSSWAGATKGVSKLKLVA